MSEKYKEDEYVVHEDERAGDTVIYISEESKLKVLEIMGNDPLLTFNEGAKSLLGKLPEDIDDETRDSLVSMILFYAAICLKLKEYGRKLANLRKRISRILTNTTLQTIFDKASFQPSEEFFANVSRLNDIGCGLNGIQKKVLDMMEGCDSKTLNDVAAAMIKNDLKSFEKSVNNSGCSYDQASKYAWLESRKKDVDSAFRKITSDLEEIYLYFRNDFPKIMLMMDGGVITAGHMRASYLFINIISDRIEECEQDMKNEWKRVFNNQAVAYLLDKFDSSMRPAAFTLFDDLLSVIKAASLMRFEESYNAANEIKEVQKVEMPKEKKPRKPKAKSVTEDEVKSLVENMVRDVQAKVDDAEDFNVPRIEAAKRLGISTDTLDNWRSRGKIKAKDRGRKVFYRKSDIDDLMK